MDFWKCYTCSTIVIPYLIISFSSANNPKGLLEVREALEKVHKVEDLLPIMKVNQRKHSKYAENNTAYYGIYPVPQNVTTGYKL